MNITITILLTAYLFVAFKSFEKFKMDTLQAIVINYIACVFTGIIFSGGFQIFEEVVLDWSWLRYAIILGILFISTFYIMALAAQKISIAVATVASKISLVIPVAVSIFIINKTPAAFSLINWLGLVLVLTAIYLTTKKKRVKGTVSNLSTRNRFLLILAVFFCTGAVDTTLNIAQINASTPNLEKAFPIILFAVAAVIGILIITYQALRNNITFQWKNIIGGLYLGIPNYFSIYFLVNTLQDHNSDGSFVYPIVNMSVIIVSALAGLIIFKEQLSRINYIGIIVAVLGITCIAWEEIF